jgi:hypothetical protein
MWSAIQWLVVRIAAIRWFLKLGWLGMLIPIALLLKTIGLPLLAILAVVGLPILALLFLFGLPIFLVLMVGGMILGFLGMVLSIGVVVIKFALFVVLPIWLIWKLCKTVFCWARKRGGDNGSSDTTTSSSDTYTSSSDTGSGPTGDPLGGVDPL